jgi:chaperonin GroES
VSKRVPFRPIGTRILIKPIEEQYKGLIVIPGTAKKDPPMQAEVVACGPGMLMKNGERWPMPCEPGQMILFEAKGPSSAIEVDGQKYAVIRDDMVIAIIEPSTDN